MSILEQNIKREWITSGSGKLWNTHGTCSAVACERLPSILSHTSCFDFLSELPPRDYRNSTLGSEDGSTAEFSRLDAAIHSLGFIFPESFKVLVTQPDIQAQIPSCTACYLELSEAVTPLPSYAGSYVVRFMNDSQSCVLWYLLFQPSMPTRVLASSYFIERDIFEAMQYENEVDEPLNYDSVLDGACICAESFD